MHSSLRIHITYCKYNFVQAFLAWTTNPIDKDAWKSPADKSAFPDLLLNQSPSLFVVVLFSKQQIQDYYTNKVLKRKPDQWCAFTSKHKFISTWE